MNEEMTKSEEQHLSLQKALQQCELVQNMIDISISSLEGLRTKCATSNDLTQKEIRTLEVSTDSAVHLHLNQYQGCHRLLFISRPLCIFFSQPNCFPLVCFFHCINMHGPSIWSPLLSVLCSAINQGCTGLQWAVKDLRILQVAEREGGSSPSE